jgi:hypothetical protein
MLMAKKGTTRKPKTATPDDINKSLSFALSLSGMESNLTIIDSVEDVLSSPESLNTIADMCSQGASVSTIEGALGIADGQLTRWLKMGRSDRDGYYRALYLFFSKANSGARMMAETALLSKNPEAWLKRCDLGSVLDNYQSNDQINLPSPEVKKGKVSKESNLYENGLTYLDTDNLPDSSIPETQDDTDNGKS